MGAPYRLRGARPTNPSAVSEVLGPKVRGYSAAAHRSSILAVTPFVLLLAYFLWLAHRGELLHWFNSMFSAGAVSVLFLLSIALISYTAVAGGGELVRVHANGILDLRAGPRAVRWDEIESLTPIVESGSVVRHLLRTQDGVTLSFGRSIHGVDELVDELRARMVEHGTPALRARIDAGESVRFGPVAATSSGLALGPRVVAWDEVGSIEAEAGEVVVRDGKGERLGAARLDEVPNAFLLAELAHERRGPKS